jgi:periplasmic protein TonB
MPPALGLARSAASGFALGAIMLAGACRKAAPPPPPERPAAATPAAPGDDPPVALNANTPLVYPTALLRAGIEGTVLVRMYADERGALVPDSIRIAESSGYPALDSAALAAAPKLHFAPARHAGKPVAAPFLQPFQFRNPARTEITP